jgi:hypothetical protein
MKAMATAANDWRCTGYAPSHVRLDVRAAGYTACDLSGKSPVRPPVDEVWLAPLAQVLPCWTGNAGQHHESMKPQPRQ